MNREALKTFIEKKLESYNISKNFRLLNWSKRPYSFPSRVYHISDKNFSFENNELCHLFYNIFKRVMFKSDK